MSLDHAGHGLDAGHVDVYDGEVLPAPAVEDYAEYVRMGGRHDLATWWERYEDQYQWCDQ